MRHGVARAGVLAFSVLVAAPIIAVVGFTTQAAAVTTGTECQGQTGGSPDHAWSVGDYCTTINTGYQSSWPSNDFYLSGPQYAAGGFLTHEIWEVTGTSGGFPFVETGLINAEDGTHDWYNPCGSTCTAYQIFWGDESGTGQYYFHWVSNISPGAGTFDYGLVWSGSGETWEVIDDLAVVGYSTVQTSSVASMAQDGQEIYPATGAISPSDYSATFNQQTEEDILGNWLEENWTGTANGAPCGSGSGYYSDGYCVNGVSYGASEWSSNVPG